MNRLRQLHALGRAQELNSMELIDLVLLLERELHLDSSDRCKYSEIIETLIHSNNLEGLELLLPFIPKDSELLISITINPELITLIRSHQLTVTLALTTVNNIKEIQYYLTNSSTPIQVDCDNEIMIEYLSWKSIPYRIIVASTSKLRELNYLITDYLGRLDQSSFFNLLWLSVRDGYEHHIIKIIEFGYTTQSQDELSQSERLFTRDCTDNFLAIKYHQYLKIETDINRYLRLINDTELKYCTDPVMEEQWLKLTQRDILNRVNNLPFLEWLKDKSPEVPTVDQIIDLYRDSSRDWDQLKIARVITLITDDATIRDDNAKFLLSNDSPLALRLIIKLCSRKVICLDEYYELNDNTNYLIEQRYSSSHKSARTIMKIP